LAEIRLKFDARVEDRYNQMPLGIAGLENSSYIMVSWKCLSTESIQVCYRNYYSGLL